MLILSYTADDTLCLDYEAADTLCLSIDEPTPPIPPLFMGVSSLGLGRRSTIPNESPRTGGTHRRHASHRSHNAHRGHRKHRGH
jgi:hypothetical protein